MQIAHTALATTRSAARARIARRDTLCRPSAGVACRPLRKRSEVVAMAAEAAASGSDDVKGPLLEPSVVNTSWARLAASVAAVAAASGTSGLLPANWAAFAHLSCWGFFSGATIWNTFFVGITMFKNLPRQMFGRVQSQLFPQYFALTSAAIGVQLATLPLLGVAAKQTLQVVLGVTLACSLGNLLVLEPICSGILKERYALENKANKDAADQQRIKVLYKKFGMWHGISSLLNLVTLCASVYHGWYLAMPLLAF